MLQLKNQRSGNKTVCDFSIISLLIGIMTFKLKESIYILLNKNINFNKNKTELKIENLTYSFRETNVVLKFI